MKLIRRQFLIKENLEMIGIAGEDALLTWCMLCSAERYVLIPNITYVYRIHDESSTYSPDNLNVEKRVKKWLSAMTKGFKYLDKYLSQKVFFKVDLEAKYLVLDALIKEFADNYIMSIYAQIPAWQLDELIKRELATLDNSAALTAFLFSRMNIFNVNSNRQGAMIQKMNAHILKQNEVIQTLQAQINQLRQK